MLSTKHTGKIDFRSKKFILKPDVIVEYNATMGGVDTLSRVINPYLIQRKGLKWYRKIAELFIDICIYNSFVLWQKLNNNINLTHLAFRNKLIEEIISFHLFGQQAFQTGSHNRPNPMRLTERHFIRRIPQKNGGRIRRNCIRCTTMGKRVASMYYCPSCNVTLCVDECFEVYHTKKYITATIFGDINLSIDSSMNTTMASINSTAEIG